MEVVIYLNMEALSTSPCLIMWRDRRKLYMQSPCRVGPAQRRRATSSWMVCQNSSCDLTWAQPLLQFYFLLTWPLSLRIENLISLDRDCEGRADAKEACDIFLNGLPKLNLWPYRSATSFIVLFFTRLTFKSANWKPNRFRSWLWHETMQDLFYSSIFLLACPLSLQIENLIGFRLWLRHETMQNFPI